MLTFDLVADRLFQNAPETELSENLLLIKLPIELPTETKFTKIKVLLGLVIK